MLYPRTDLYHRCHVFIDDLCICIGPCRIRVAHYMYTGIQLYTCITTLYSLSFGGAEWPTFLHSTTKTYRNYGCSWFCSSTYTIFRCPISQSCWIPVHYCAKVQILGHEPISELPLALGNIILLVTISFLFVSLR